MRHSASTPNISEGRASVSRGKLDPLHPDVPMGRYTGRDSANVTELEGGRRKVPSDLKMESVDAPSFFLLSLDKRKLPQDIVYPVNKFPALNDVIVPTEHLPATTLVPGDIDCVKKKPVFDPIIGLVRYRNCQETRRFRQAREQLNVNVPLIRDDFMRYDFPPDYSQEALNRYKRMRDAHSESLQSDQQAFHFKRSYNDCTSYISNLEKSRDMIRGIHPLFAPNDIIKNRPQTTSRLSNRSLSPGNSPLSTKRSSRVALKGQEEGAASTYSTSSPSERSQYSLQTSLNTTQNSTESCSSSSGNVNSLGSNNDPQTSLVIDQSHHDYAAHTEYRRSTPKQWIGFRGLGSGTDFHYKDFVRQQREERQTTAKKMAAEASVLFDNIAQFERHLGAVAKAAVF